MGETRGEGSVERLGVWEGVREGGREDLGEHKPAHVTTTVSAIVAMTGGRCEMQIVLAERMYGARVSVQPTCLHGTGGTWLCDLCK